MSSLKVCILLQAFLLAFVQSDLEKRVNYALLKNATQSSTDGEKEASRAVDALVETYSLTKSTEDPWWSVDLGAPHLILEIRFQAFFLGSRGDHRIDVLLSKEVLGNITEANDNYVLCGSIEKFGQKVVAKCPSKDVHRCVLLRVSGTGLLGISSVSVYGNQYLEKGITLSRLKEATLSSTDGEYEASLALDADQDTYSKTKYTLDPWWSVDLGAPQQIQMIYFKVDLFGEGPDFRLDFILSNEVPLNLTIVKEGYFNCGSIDTSRKAFAQCLPEDLYRFVLLRASGIGTLLIYNVGVRGNQFLINHAWYKDTTQSSTAGDHESNLAVDANETTCSQTEETVDPWWSMDLGATYLIEKVEVKGELTGETNEPISAEMILSQESSSTLGKHFNRWNTTGKFKEKIQNPRNESYRYLILKVEGKAGLKVCEVLVLEDLLTTTSIEHTSEANETSPIKQESFNHLTWALPLFGVVFCLGVLGFMALRLSKNKAKGETVANGSNR